MPCFEAVELANIVDSDTHRIKDERVSPQEEVNEEAIKVLDKIKEKALHKRFKQELLH